MPIRPLTSGTVLGGTSRDEFSLDAACPPYESFTDLATSTTTAPRQFFKGPWESGACGYYLWSVGLKLGLGTYQVGEYDFRYALHLRGGDLGRM